jgi:hypothetical protein
MCFYRNKSPARWPDCTGGVGPCSTHDPDHDFVQWCPDAVTRGGPCENPTSTSQASSTKRKMNYLNYRNQPKPPPGSRNQGARGAKDNGSLAAQRPGVRVNG